jgi:D-glycero-D-manno-heptose 1,7-bisphosphate phosphatase
VTSRALFLDRDGVINVDCGYVHRPEQVEFVDGIFELCRAAKSAGYLRVVVTNQAGIGRGFYTERDFETLTDWMGQRFDAEGASLDGVYHCPTHPTAGVGAFRVESDRRKPAPGMILQAARDFDIDLAASILVGDKDSDIEAGRRAGIGRNVLLMSAACVHVDPPAIAVRSLRDVTSWFARADVRLATER